MSSPKGLKKIVESMQQADVDMKNYETDILSATTLKKTPALKAKIAQLFADKVALPDAIERVRRCK